MASLFFVRYKRIVLDTFVLVLVLTGIVTLFVPYTYQASAVVALPEGSSPAQEAGRLLSPSTMPYSSASETHGWAFPSPDGKTADLVVEAGNPEFTARYADAWAEKWAVLHGDRRYFLRRAVVPQREIKPKKAENMIVGGVFGLILGLLFAFCRALIGDMIETVRRKKCPAP